MPGRVQDVTELTQPDTCPKWRPSDRLQPKVVHQATAALGQPRGSDGRSIAMVMTPFTRTKLRFSKNSDQSTASKLRDDAKLRSRRSAH